MNLSLERIKKQQKKNSAENSKEHAVSLHALLPGIR